MNSIEWVDSIWTDLRYASRELRKHPFITATAALMLAAEIGVNVAVFSIVNAVLFKGYSGVRDNDRLVYKLSRAPRAVRRQRVDINYLAPPTARFAQRGWQAW